MIAAAGIGDHRDMGQQGLSHRDRDPQTTGGRASGWGSRTVLPVAHCVLAPNPGPMTLDGTNTWVLGDLDGGRVVVVDPGPDDAAHLDAVTETVAERGARVGAVLLTHGHLDHSEGARRFAERHRVGVRALDPAHRLGSQGLVEGDVVDAGGVRIDVLATPGHSSDSLCFVVGGHRAVLTGDTVLGRGTAVIYHPDGVLADYLDSLNRLERLVGELGCTMLLPGHGPVLEDPAGVVRHYLDHRAERLVEVRGALDAGARSAAEVVERVYADVPRTLWPAAERSVHAALAYLGVAGTTSSQGHTM